MRIGVHVSIGQGFAGAMEQARELGCDGFQIFAGNPRGWARKPIIEQETTAFKAKREVCQLWPVVVHLAYLPNPATTDQELYLKSVTCLLEDFQRANQLAADFFVFHPGKTGNLDEGIKQVVRAVNLALKEIKGNTVLLFENQAGSKNDLGSKFSDIARLIEQVDQLERVGVCFDTCHAFASGYDIRTPEDWEKVQVEIEQTFGLSYLKMFHINDAMGELGSHLDRHQHIGEGAIGLSGFKCLVNHPVFSKLPGILETPQQTLADDLKNIATLRKLMKDGSK